jgi:CobQ-like glutamine amidotransferase family enzyme
MLRADGGLRTAVDAGAAVLAVCAGFQLIGTSLPGAQGITIEGLGLVDAHTVYTDDPRCVGELFVAPAMDESAPMYTGFENHQGRTQIGQGMQPLGWVLSGFGNGLPTDTSQGRIPEGVVDGRVIGTYMHGPVLARNPELADQILASVAGELAPYGDSFAQDFAYERRQAFTR